ncbi:hypothetical protein BKA65DRAFT_574530 [Rhexocercosporidium sp. MPI-PUGE-AT-0058]|nr:hypothetical protein BKA65DRAFT_574530 [Rhexocercosporidium sp. MPI-PUGE-AT-0058]
MARVLPKGLLLLSISVSIRALATCYYPDGIHKEPGHVPCNQTTSSASACCDPRDSCSESGICLGASGWDYRGSCTDQSWTSDNCPGKQWDSCITDTYSRDIKDPSTNEKYGGFTAIWSCSPPGTRFTEFCCAQGDSSQSCCNSSFDLGSTGLAFKPGYDAILASLTQSSTAPTATSDSSDSQCSHEGVTSTYNDNSTSNDNLGTKVGLGVGIPLGVLILGLLSWLFYREFAKKKHGNAFGGAGAGVSEMHMPSHSISSPSALSPMVQNNTGSTSGYAFGGGYSDQPSPPLTGATAVQQPQQQHSSYSSQPLKTNPYNLSSPLYEAPPNNVHEMRA